ncbi:hypothetical protein PAECIP111891_04231 [Paenibacillus allorhizoplanae]|uniref:Uncharacterized protein n=1 Tax=Paenibacillus allorhizoplanae TaxID=2905648 RepID=A0ABN8GT77_9BACL|nr:DUF1642 domain-containing protein [Paenibacillus allorhizoplanae]CAH1215215.1 hypothetical protein PAECIP111891_04231 [Paenibacillus allorhizoplanae]
MKLSEIFLKGIQFSLNTGLKSFESKTVSRLMEHIRDVEEEKVLLLQQIEREAEAQKLVVIPLEVAEAIEYYKLFGYLNNWGVMDCIRSEQSKVAVIARESLNKTNGWNNLLSAILNGYTVETVESKIKVAISDVRAKWSRIDFNDYQESTDCFDKMVFERVTQIIREDQAAVQ